MVSVPTCLRPTSAIRNFFFWTLFKKEQNLKQKNAGIGPFQKLIVVGSHVGLLVIMKGSSQIRSWDWVPATIIYFLMIHRRKDEKEWKRNREMSLNPKCCHRKQYSTILRLIHTTSVNECCRRLHCRNWDRKFSICLNALFCHRRKRQPQLKWISL